MPGTVCQHCGENPATIHYTEIGDDERIETHMCEECASAQGLTSDATQGLLAGVLSAERGGADETIQCPHCGITWREFRRKGRLGCPRDYEVFATQLDPLIEKMHGGKDRHVGRLPRGELEVETGRSDRLLRLRRALQEAIDEEHYERAAQLRDEIVEIESDA